MNKIEASLPVLIGLKFLEYLNDLEDKKFADEELSKDVDALRSRLVIAYQSLNSFDEYYSEVKSGNLEWSPPHKSELFWKDNASRLLDHNCEVLKLLSGLLNSSSDPAILSIALHDINMFLAHYSLSVRVIDTIGIKSRVMMLISHENSDVRYNALSAMQTYMKRQLNQS